MKEYNHKNLKLINADCIDIMKEYKDNYFDLAIVDPPYGIKIQQSGGTPSHLGFKNFINPPYSRKLKEAFIMKAIEESRKGKLCVMLLPVSTSTKIFHDHILPNKKEIRFIRRRLKFSGYNTKGEYVDNKCGMHDSMIVIF